jgi:hypothetical protein
VYVTYRLTSPPEIDLLLQLAGGLVGGAALVGGAVAAYKHYDKKKDQVRAIDLIIVIPDDPQS